LINRSVSNTRCTWRKYKNKDLWFSEECTEKKTEMKEALRKFKEKMMKAEFNTGETERHRKEQQRIRCASGRRR
jgi:hypothetical protein